MSYKLGLNGQRKLTFTICHGWQALDRIGDRDRSRSKHFLVQLLLLECLQLVFELSLIDRVANVYTTHSLDDLFAESNLLLNFGPVSLVSAVS